MADKCWIVYGFLGGLGCPALRFNYYNGTSWVFDKTKYRAHLTAIADAGANAIRRMPDAGARDNHPYGKKGQFCEYQYVSESVGWDLDHFNEAYFDTLGEAILIENDLGLTTFQCFADNAVYHRATSKIYSPWVSNNNGIDTVYDADAYPYFDALIDKYLSEFSSMDVVWAVGNEMDNSGFPALFNAVIVPLVGTGVGKLNPDKLTYGSCSSSITNTVRGYLADDATRNKVIMEVHGWPASVYKSRFSPWNDTGARMLFSDDGVSTGASACDKWEAGAAPSAAEWYDAIFDVLTTYGAADGSDDHILNFEHTFMSGYDLSTTCQAATIAKMREAYEAWVLTTTGPPPPPGATVPITPSGLTATISGATTVTLAWTDNSINEVDFHIEKSTTYPGTAGFTQIATVAANVVTYAATGLAEGESVWFRVRAHNITGYSGYTNIVLAVIPAAVSMPKSPQRLANLPYPYGFKSLDEIRDYLIKLRSKLGMTDFSVHLGDIITKSGAMFPDPSLGAIIYGNDVPEWVTLLGNTTTECQFLLQTGTGAVLGSAAPVWSTTAQHLTLSDSAAAPYLKLINASDTTRDPIIQWAVGATPVTKFTMGVDDSDADDAFRIGKGTTLETETVLYSGNTNTLFGEGICSGAGADPSAMMNSVIVGDDAARLAAGYWEDNVIIGSQVGYNVRDDSTTGTQDGIWDSVIIGPYAAIGVADTLLGINTVMALGYEVLGNAKGYFVQDIFIGDAAGYSINTTGQTDGVCRAIVIGGSAFLGFTPTGDNWGEVTAIGYSALYSYIDDLINNNTQIISIGNDSFHDMEYGTENVGIGAEVFYHGGTIDVAGGTAGLNYCTAVGNYAGIYQDTPADGLTFFGYGAGHDTGRYGYVQGDIVAIGRNALNIIAVSGTPYFTTEKGSIYIGSYSGWDITNVVPPATGPTGVKAAGAGLEIGNYRYRTSFVLDGKETMLGKASTSNITTTAGNLIINVAAIPVYSGPRTCSARKLYRSKVGGSLYLPYYLVATIGDNSTVIYADSTPDANLTVVGPSTSYSVAIGYGAKVWAANQLVVGGDTGGYIDEVYLGNGIVNATPLDVTINASGGVGTNIAAADLILAGGRATGNAASGDIIFKTGAVGASGTALQTLAERFKIQAGTAGVTTAYPITSTIADGTPPFVLASTTKVENLNADTLDGLHAADIVASAVWSNIGSNPQVGQYRIKEMHFNASMQIVIVYDDVPEIAIGDYPTILSSPGSGEYRIKALRLDSGLRVVVVYDATPEP